MERGQCQPIPQGPAMALLPGTTDSQAEEHVRNGGEQSVRSAATSYFIDGYDALTRTFYEFHVCIYRGFSLNVRGAAVLNFQTMKDNILAELENPLDHRRTTNVVTPYYFQRDLEQKQIKVVPRIKQYVTLHRNLMLKVKARSRHACTTRLQTRLHDTLSVP